MLGERRLDLAELDTEAAHLHLAVDPPEVFEIAVPAPARQVAGAVEPQPAHPAGEGIGHEPLRGEGGAGEIPPRHPGAADVDLPRHADRHRPAAAVEQVEREVGQRPADDAPRLRQVALPQPSPGRVHRRLRDAVHVDQQRPLLAVALEPRGERRGIQRLAAEDHQAQVRDHLLAAREGRLLGPEELPEGRGRLAEHRHPLPSQQLVERLGRAGRLSRHDDEPPTEGERPPQLPHREVEGDRVKERPDVVWIRRRRPGG